MKVMLRARTGIALIYSAAHACSNHRTHGPSSQMKGLI